MVGKSSNVLRKLKLRETATTLAKNVIKGKEGGAAVRLSIDNLVLKATSKPRVFNFEAVATVENARPWLGGHQKLIQGKVDAIMLAATEYSSKLLNYIK